MNSISNALILKALIAISFCFSLPSFANPSQSEMGMDNQTETLMVSTETQAKSKSQKVANNNTQGQTKKF